MLLRWRPNLSRLALRRAGLALALLLGLSLAAPGPALAGERLAASSKYKKKNKKRKKTIDGPEIPVQFHTLIQPQLDPWIMWWVRPWMMPGKAAPPPPKKARRRPPKLSLPAAPGPIAKPLPRSANPGKSVTLSPRFSFMGGNELNDELTLGFTLDLWPSEQAGVEFNVSAFPLTGADNTKPLAPAVLRLLPPLELLESKDRVMAFTTSLITAPFSGTLAPPGAPPVFIEFLVGVGGGIEFADIEMLSYSVDADSYERVEVSVESGRYMRPVGNLLIGSRIFPMPGLGLRTDLRLMGGPGNVLSFDDESAANQNEFLRQSDPTLNRLSCLTNVEAMCKLKLEASLTIEFGIDISLGAPRRGARR